MINMLDVTYVRMGTPDLAHARKFALEVLGLDVSDQVRDALCFKSDDRAHTLCYFKGDPADNTVGFEVADMAALEAAAVRLEGLGRPVRLATASEAEQRMARAVLMFEDANDNRLELVVRPAYDGRRYHGTRDAGITGFSHVGLHSRDPVRDERFWTDVTNARVSDRIGDAPLLRIDEVHHSIALFPSARRGVQHVNHQVQGSDDIMRSWALLKEKRVPIVFGPGRHPTSSARFLYFEGPDGMVFEYSSGVRSIADELPYREKQFPFEPKGFCQWGAKPVIAEFRN